jgi:hypothetical protein
LPFQGGSAYLGMPGKLQRSPTACLDAGCSCHSHLGGRAPDAELGGLDPSACVPAGERVYWSPPDSVVDDGRLEDVAADVDEGQETFRSRRFRT